MEHADFQEQCLAEDFFDVLTNGIKLLSNLQTATLSGRWGPLRYFHVTIELNDGKGSPLARSWDPCYLRADGRFFQTSDDPNHQDGSSEFARLTVALSKAQKHIRTFTTEECDILPSTFDTTASAFKIYGCHGLQRFSRLETLILSFDNPDGRPCKERYANLNGLHILLRSVPLLKCLKLRLPEDERKLQVQLFHTSLVFPDNVQWSHLSTFSIRNLEINVRDFIGLLFLQMPHLHHLSLNCVDLLDGCWESVFDFLRVSDRLHSLHLSRRVKGFTLLHHGKTEYVPKLDDSYSLPKIWRHSSQFLESIETYVVNWRGNPDLRHPSLQPDQPSEKLLDYLRDLFQCCERVESRDGSGELIPLMTNYYERYMHARSLMSQRSALVE